MQRTSPYLPLLQARIPGLRVQQNADLTQRTSMKMRSRASVFVEASDAFSLRTFLYEAKMNDWPAYLLGGGKNTLFANSTFDGVVFSLGKNFARTEYLGGNFIRAGAGVQLPRLLQFMKDCDLMGLEFMNMVPGTVGGSLAGNAGAGGWGLCDFVERVFLMSRDGFVACVDRNQFRYSYRHSELREAIVLEADFRLEPMNKREHERRMADFRDKKKGQPYSLPSSGCIFKNPRTGENGACVSAGKLIDEAGLKGYAIRSAAISDQHANFIVNLGDSSGEDFLALISFVKDVIYEKHGVELETEVQIVGGPLSTALL